MAVETLSGVDVQAAAGCEIRRAVQARHAAARDERGAGEGRGEGDEVAKARVCKERAGVAAAEREGR